MTWMLAAIAVCAQEPKPAFPAKLGTAYKIGVVGEMIVGKEQFEIGRTRTVTLHAAWTAVAHGTKDETIVAGEGKKLLILDATIANPEKKETISVSSPSSFGLRVYDSKGKAEDFKYRGGALDDGGLLDKRLAPGQSVRIVQAYEWPAQSPNIRIGIYYHTYYPQRTPKFDLTNVLSPSKSGFARGNMNYEQKQVSTVGKRFDLDALDFTVKGVRKTEDGGWVVRVEISNRMLRPEAWGWQYAEAHVTDATGKETRFFPAFTIDPAFADWRLEVKPGQAVSGEYAFYPSDGAAPKSFRLTSNATKRSVEVSL